MSKKSIRRREENLRRQMRPTKNAIIVDSIPVDGNNSPELVAMRARICDQNPEHWQMFDPSGRGWVDARKGNGVPIKVSTR